MGDREDVRKEGEIGLGKKTLESCEKERRKKEKKRKRKRKRKEKSRRRRLKEKKERLVILSARGRNATYLKPSQHDFGGVVTSMVVVSF